MMTESSYDTELNTLIKRNRFVKVWDSPIMTDK